MKITLTELLGEDMPKDVMLPEEDAELSARIKESVMRQIEQEKNGKSRHRRKTLGILALAAALTVLLTVTAYAAGLFGQRLDRAQGTVSGTWIFRNGDGTTEVQKMEYPEAGYVITTEGTGTIPNVWEVRAGWLPSEKEQEGQWLRFLRDENISGDPRKIPYEVKFHYAVPGLTLVLNGECSVVKEEVWDRFQVTEITAAWNTEYVDPQNFILMKDEANGFILQVAGNDDFETLEHIARELELRDTGEQVQVNPDFNIGIMNVGRG